MIWVNAIAELTKSNTGFVLVTILGTKGSAPRDSQSKMVVTKEAIFDTIGGGKLEYLAMDAAREYLKQNTKTLERRIYNLGPDAEQCCGGEVELLYESYPSCDFNIVIAGAGHVGAALVTILSELPCRVILADGRSEFLQTFQSAHWRNVTCELVENPYASVEQCPENAYYLIMTHSHEIDLEWCEAILNRNDVQYCGLIGSKSKGAKFRSRLKKKGFTAEEVAKLTSPIGLKLGSGKMPMEVAVSVVSQLMQDYYGRKQPPSAIPLSLADNLLQTGS